MFLLMKVRGNLLNRSHNGEKRIVLLHRRLIQTVVSGGISHCWSMVTILEFRNNTNISITWIKQHYNNSNFFVTRNFVSILFVNSQSHIYIKSLLSILTNIFIYIIFVSFHIFIIFHIRFVFYNYNMFDIVKSN